MSDLVIGRLSSIIKEQFAEVESLGITACCLMDLLEYLKLRDSAFCQPYCKKAENCIVDTFHGTTLDRQENKIVEILKSTTQASVK